MLRRRVVSCSWVLCTVVGIGVAQSTPVSLKRPLRAVSKNAKEQAAELNRRGSNSVQAKNFEEAKSLFNQAIRLDPSLADAYENLALLSLLEGDDRTAESRALELQALSPGNYNGRFVAGVAAINQNKFSQGKAYLAPLITSDVPDPLVAAAYAIALEETGRKTKASQVRAKFVRAKVEAHDALLAGQIFREPRLRGQAEKWLEASVKSDETTAKPEMLYMLAGMYADQGRNTEAASLYGRVLEVNPGNVNALVELSELERSLGQQEKSVSHLYAAKTLAAKDVPSLIHFSHICVRRHMYVDARDALQKVVDAEPRNREAWYQLGLAQFRIGEADAAEKDFRTALALDENDEWPRVGLGAVLLSTSRQEAAAVEFERVLRRDSRCSAAYYYLAQIHRAKGELPLARRELEQAVAYADADARPLAALGQVQLAQHDLSSARVSLEKALQLDPASATAHYYMAALLRATGEEEEAKKELERFSKYHDDENKKGIVGLVLEGKWEYAGFLPSN